MILDIILAIIIAINLLLGLKRGLLVMLGRLLMLFLIVAATLLLLGPLTDTLARAPFIAPIEQQFGDSVLKPLVSSAANLGAAVDSLGLPVMLSDLIKTQLPALNSTLAEGYPQLTSILFRFLLSAAVFILMLIAIVVVISVLTKVLTKAADKIPLLGPANRLGGLVAGLVIGLLQISIILLIMGFLSPTVEIFSQAIDSSWIADQFFKIDIKSWFPMITS